MKKVNYRFTMVPYALNVLFDSTLLSMFIALLRTSDFFSNSDGYFNCTKNMLRKYFGGSESDFLTAMDVFESLGILTVKKDFSKTLFRINAERFSDFDKIPTDVLLANIRSITLKNGKTFKLEKLLKQSDSSIDNRQNKVIETTEMTVDNTFEDDVKRNGKLACQLLKQRQEQQSNKKTLGNSILKQLITSIRRFRLPFTLKN